VAASPDFWKLSLQCEARQNGLRAHKYSTSKVVFISCCNVLYEKDLRHFHPAASAIDAIVTVGTRSLKCSYRLPRPLIPLAKNVPLHADLLDFARNRRIVN
jgi:hypothetical protein